MTSRMRVLFTQKPELTRRPENPSAARYIIVQVFIVCVSPALPPVLPLWKSYVGHRAAKNLQVTFITMHLVYDCFMYLMETVTNSLVHPTLF